MQRSAWPVLVISLSLVACGAADGGTSTQPGGDAGPDVSQLDGDASLDVAPGDSSVDAPPVDAEQDPDVKLELEPEPLGRGFERSLLLGEGGFFGISGRVLGDPSKGATIYAVGAHYAVMSDGVPGGRVYLFDMESWPTSVADAIVVLQAPDRAPQGGFGFAIGGGCDVNGDGFMDLPVGNHLYSPSTELAAAGRVVLFVGSADGFDLASTELLQLDEDHRGRYDSMGQTVTCSDFDGDGFDDVMAGGQNAGAANTGLVAIWSGGPGGPAELADRLLVPAQLEKSQYLGASSLSADLDGDGLVDLAVGGWGLIAGEQPDGDHTGGIAIYLGGEDWSTGPGLTLTVPEGIPMSLGAIVGLAGDSLVAAAPHYVPCDGTGALGSCCRDDQPCDAPLVCSDAFDYPVCSQPCDGGAPCPEGSECIGVEVGDDVRDLCLLTCDEAVTCPATMGCTPASDTVSVCAPGPDTGAVYVWATGSHDSLTTAPVRLDAPPGAYDQGFGSALAFAPDFFGEGQGALLVGMQYADQGGAVAVYPSSDAGGFDAALGMLMRSPTTSDWDGFGGSITPLGDVDGDGLDDFSIGIHSHVEGDPFGDGIQTGGVVFYH